MDRWKRLIFACAMVASPAISQAQERDVIEYSVHAAAFSSLIAYCRAKYGPLSRDSRAGECFMRAKEALPGIGLAGVASQIRKKCRDPSKMDSCITPELSHLTNKIINAVEAVNP